MDWPAPSPAAEANEDRFERKGRAFHEKLREGFHAIAEAEPRRCKVIDAAQDVDAVSRRSREAVEERVHG